MTLFIISIILGLGLLVWSADKFVDSASSLADSLGMSPLLIGMLVVGFGTSAPEIVVSAISSLDGNPGLALGNAIGSNIANIALILGITALVMPIGVHSKILKKELPLLASTVVLTGILLRDLSLSRLDAWILLVAFFVIMGWTIWQGLWQGDDSLGADMLEELEEKKTSVPKASVWLLIGLVLLLMSSKMLVWGGVGLAKGLGVSDIIIGLTIVAIGTSLPELAASVVAAKKGESDLALGNVIGSNLFNTLAVIGISGSIMPFSFNSSIYNRDFYVMAVLTGLLFIVGLTPRGKAKMNRLEGGLFFTIYLVYTTHLIREALS